ncbi:MAG: flagellar hook-length control protein FliK, partial [Clostridiales bacterium]|nr:flagellar hook-length control protein FliK [Clostridiales bacterium]
LPAAPENIKEIKSAVSLLSFILKNSALVERGLKISREEDLIHQPIDRLVKWLVGSEQPDSIEGLDAQHQKLMLILEELAGVEVEDIITLMRFGLKITPGNLMLAKNLRENKGFPGILLKSIYEEPESMDKTQRPNGQPKAEEETAFWEAAKGRREDRKGPGAQNLAGSKAEPVDLKNLLKGIIESNRAAPRQRAAAELLMERVRFLEEVLSDRNLLVFPFLFDGQISECWIRVSQGNGKFKQQESELELVVETEPPNLGSIRVQIKLKDKRVDLNFFVLKEQAKSLIEKEKENLRQSIERSGFSVNRISCRRMEDIRPETVRRFLDLRV